MKQYRKSPTSAFILFWRMGGWSVLIATALLCLLTVWSVDNYRLAAEFEAEGIRTTSTVIDKETRERRNSEGHRRTSYYLTLAFVTETGQDVLVTRSVGRSKYDRVAIGHDMALQYLPRDPTVVEYLGESHLTTGRVMQFWMLVLGVAWLVSIWKVGGWTVDAIRARRYGAELNAVVRDEIRIDVRINKRYRYRITWTDEEGQPGESLMYGWLFTGQWKAGDQIKVFRGVHYTWWEADVGSRYEASSQIPAVPLHPGE